jgi:hypothetical protein
MPVLLTEETGLSEQLTKGMVLRKLREPEDIVRSVLEIEQNYEQITKDAMGPIPERSWEQVADEWMGLLKGVLDNAAHREEKSITEPDSTKDSMHKAKVRVH